MIEIILVWSIVGLATWFAMSAVAYGSCGAIGSARGIEFINPCHIYKYNHVNWFGAILLALFYSAICPIGSICYWLYKLCTIGRKY